MNEWISVKDKNRLPKFCQRILIVYCGDIIREGYYHSISDKWFIYNRYGDAEVEATHWMPLPEPPKEVE